MFFFFPRFYFSTALKGCREDLKVHPPWYNALCTTLQNSSGDSWLVQTETSQMPAEHRQDLRPWVPNWSFTVWAWEEYSGAANRKLRDLGLLCEPAPSESNDCTGMSCSDLQWEGRRYRIHQACVLITCRWELKFNWKLTRDNDQVQVTSSLCPGAQSRTTTRNISCETCGFALPTCLGWSLKSYWDVSPFSLVSSRLETHFSFWAKNSDSFLFPNNVKTIWK